MNNSSNSIFHFTDQFNVIANILHDQTFFGSYCKEVLEYNGEKLPLYIPMISFCDIPIKTYSNLGAPYGRYGIGISMECAVRHRLTPVLYIDKNSSLLNSLMTSLKSGERVTAIATKLAESGQENGKQVAAYLAQSVEYIIYSLYHTKHYRDTLVRKDKTYDNYKFYDEREWRFIPDFECAVCELRIAAEQYEQWRGKGEKPLLKEKVNLQFEMPEIEHIIVATEKEVDQIIDIINGLPNELFKNYRREHLITKITTFEKIESDF